MLLKRLSLLPERVSDWSDYPFNVPTIASLRDLEIEKPVVFFVGENGSGRSTLLEAIAIHYGFGGEGGNRNFSSKTTDSVRSVEPLVSALRIAFSRRIGRGFECRVHSLWVADWDWLPSPHHLHSRRSPNSTYRDPPVTPTAMRVPTRRTSKIPQQKSPRFL